ncbi:4Fe-4S ferredoxin [Vulcanimicrobium alpinum]|uniref:4Fe-4S ferredoxin n=1 Tax=Vulcanimicrobium alpinum TaxID=3016050 RepID=A0AAN1XX72_UNVUL|nr:tRNA epoxyqueuosine(34) reductase QueG [Vulcanimicrobium alpinum]BDE06246.1 4Fe-4S ferredoxin [Vulcanimicrobium alpinum]
MKALARARGAAAVRIASAQPDALTRERMRAAFARGDLATWPYGEAYAAAASDPATLLPGARSVVCIAIPYATPVPRERRGYGRVSAYAWSADYHRAMRAQLAAIAAEIDALAGGAVTRVVCDTAPLAERAFAARAGLGWIGKHTSLIVKGLGSAVFLGEIVTTLALDADAPLRTSCGSCTRCISACPTSALRSDGTIDATRCISDLTQRRDAIPTALRPFVGTWVWGCDLCNDACPPSQRAGRAGDARFSPLEAQTAAPPLGALLALRDAAFRRWRRTAMGWRGAAVLRRNAAVAMGNALDRADVPALAEALRDDASALVRGHAAWALGRIASPRALDALRAAQAGERDPDVIEEILAALEPWRTAAALHHRTP